MIDLNSCKCGDTDFCPICQARAKKTKPGLGEMPQELIDAEMERKREEKGD